MARVLIFELLVPPTLPVPLVQRVPGATLSPADLLKPRPERTPPDTELIKRILDALREW